MTNTIVTEKPRVVEIDIIRSSHFYFYNKREDGKTTINAERISRDRAKEIYEANRGHGRQRTINQVDFSELRPCEWSWTITMEASHGQDD